VVYSFLHTTKNLGVPGSSRGTLECNRVDLTIYLPEKAAILFFKNVSLLIFMNNLFQHV
jgi:hypothetical protein